MFDKISIQKNHLHCTPDRLDNKLPLLIMSHGSGGISDIDLDFASIACNNGYQVAIIDHFSSRDISYNLLNSIDELRPSFQEREQDILDVCEMYDVDKKLAFGISAGGTAAISVSDKFQKVFTVYPALVAITSRMLGAKNITIVTGVDDNWTPADQAKKFAQHVESDLHLVQGYHGFLNPRQSRNIDRIISLRNIDLPVPYDGSLADLDYEKGIRLEYNLRSRIYTENLFIEWLS